MRESSEESVIADVAEQVQTGAFQRYSLLRPKSLLKLDHDVACVRALRQHIERSANLLDRLRLNGRCTGTPGNVTLRRLCRS